MKQQSPFVVICHEFFDAMPAFIFEYSELGWVEKLVDKAPEIAKGTDFAWTNSEPFSKSVKKILNPDVFFEDKELKSKLKVGDRIEICPKSLVLANSIAELLGKVDGALIAVDYGANHAYSDSLRGISGHKYLRNDQILEVPGEVDLSTYVNFRALSEAIMRVDGMKKPKIIT